MCCPAKICCCCICLVLVVVTVGVFFGFGVYKHGFKKIKKIFKHESDATFVYGGATTYTNGRPFLGYNPPPPFWG